MKMKQSFLTNLWMEFLFLMSSSGQPWRRGSSVSFLILMSYQSTSLIVFYEYLSHQYETIRHHQHSSFLTNMIVKQSFLTNLWMEFLLLMSSSGATPVKRAVYNLSVTSKLLSDSRQWSKLHFSLTNTTIHHHQYSSFMTNMTVKQSFLTNL